VDLHDLGGHLGQVDVAGPELSLRSDAGEQLGGVTVPPVAWFIFTAAVFRAWSAL
jgi:hypothetical protein